MSIDAIGGISPAGFLEGLGGAGRAGATSSVQGTVPTQGTGAEGSVFGATLAGSVDRLQAMQSTSDALAVRAVTGDLDDVHDYTIASAQASVAFELTAALRNKAVEAFTEIMRMQA